MSTPAHRLGRRTSLLEPAPGPRASLAEFLTVAADPGAAAEVAASARLVCRTAAGRVELPLAAVDTIAVHELLPARRPASYRGMRNYIGQYPVPSPAGPASVGFESLNELSHIRDLVLTEPVQSLAAQPFLLVWELAGGRRYHYPDFLVGRQGQRALLCDVTRAETWAQPKAVAQFQLTALTALAAGWEFQLRSEMPAQRRRTQSFLGVPHPGHEPRLAGWRALLVGVRWPAQLHTVAARVGAGSAGRAAVLALIAAGDLFIDFDLPLTEHSEVRDRPFPASAPWVRRW